jgi:hypothetical protein
VTKTRKPTPVRKMVPMPPSTFDLLQQYRDGLVAEVPHGTHIPLHAALAHALHIAKNVRLLNGGQP